MSTTQDRWQLVLNAESLSWLLERDEHQPGVRLLTLSDVLRLPSTDDEVAAARGAAMSTGPVPAILDAMHPDGYWVEPGAGYFPKYRGTVWQLVFLAQLGADGSDARVRAACEYALDHSRAPYGGFSMDGKNVGLIHCLQGNLCAALVDLGTLGDERLDEALDWLARSITGSGIAPSDERKTADVHFYRSGNSAPGFACSANGHQGCAWGAIKAMRALSGVPESARTDQMRTAIEAGVTFLLDRDPADADYPMGQSTKPNRSWFKFGFPVGYITDVLQNLEVLTALGCGGDLRLERGIRMLLDKQDEHGRWPLEYTYNGKTWVDVEEKGSASKWVTLRAMRVLSRMEGELLETVVRDTSMT